MSRLQSRPLLIGAGLVLAACLAERAEVVSSFGDGGDSHTSGGKGSGVGGAADGGTSETGGSRGAGEAGGDSGGGTDGGSSGGGGDTLVEGGRADGGTAGSSDGGTGVAGTGGGEGPGPNESCDGMLGNECNGESCCASAKVPGGAATLGSGAASYAAKLSTFWLDKYEVSVGRFRKYLDAYQGAPAVGAGKHPLIADSGWKEEWTLPATAGAIKASLICHSTLSTWKEPMVDAAHETLPINCLTWYEALAFCAWDGGRLPTEAEWEYAATSGPEVSAYPWGNATPTIDHAVFDCKTDGVAGCAVSDIFSVGSRAQGRGAFGHYDQAGSLWEWTLDLYDAYPAQCTDCANVSTGTQRNLRGGSFFSTLAYISPRYRSPQDPQNSTVTEYAGVRCARD